MILPRVASGRFLFATVAIQTASNSLCTDAGIPFSCCTGSASGSCQDASSASIEVPAGWTEIQHDTCGSDLTMSLAYRIAQPGDFDGMLFSWNFLGAGQPSDSSSCTGFGTPDACCTGTGTGTCPYSTFLGAGGITEVSNVDTITPIENVSSLCTLDSATLTAPSITTTENNSLVLLAYGVVGSNDMTEPAGFSLVYKHDIGGVGVDMANFTSSLVYPTSGTDTGDQISTATTPGDNLGYQIGLSPPLP